MHGRYSLTTFKKSEGCIVPEGNPLGIEKVEVKSQRIFFINAKKEQEQEWIGGYEVVATDIPKVLDTNMG